MNDVFFEYRLQIRRQNYRIINYSDAKNHSFSKGKVSYSIKKKRKAIPKVYTKSNSPDTKKLPVYLPLKRRQTGSSRQKNINSMIILLSSQL